MNMLHRGCIICGENTNLKKLYDLELSLPKDYKIQSSYGVVRCENCGFCYADTLSTLEEYEEYYRTYNYYGQSGADPSEGNFARELAWNMLEKVVDKDATALDVGFGNASSLLEMKKRGWNHLFGVDPSLDSVKKAQEKGIEAYEGSVFSLDTCFTQKVDVVLLTGVLEHLLEPVAALEKVKQVLNHQGYLLLTVPNCLNLSKDYSEISNNFNQEHINYFSSISLDNMMNMAGFDRVDILEDAKYRDLLALYQYTGVTTQIVKEDKYTSEAILDYVAYNEQKKNEQNRQLKEIIDKKQKVAVWGTGSYCMSLLSNSILKQCELVCFVDNNEKKNQTLFAERMIYLPSMVPSWAEIDVCLIACHGGGEEIAKQLRELGFEGDIRKF